MLRNIDKCWILERNLVRADLFTGLLSIHVCLIICLIQCIIDSVLEFHISLFNSQVMWVLKFDVIELI